jgi:hypothetical protein
MYQSLSEKEEFIATQIIDIAIKLHKALGPGLLESVYEKCFCYELQIDDGLRLDILIDDLVVVELKAQENYHPIWEAQLLSYLKLTELRLGFLINFHVPLMKQGIKRMINTPTL